MKRTDDPFLNILPSVDLHGLDRITAIIKTREFITDNIKLKNYKIVVIHGKGTGILKEEVHKFLKKDKRVETFKQDNFNDGLTIVTLKN